MIDSQGSSLIETNVFSQNQVSNVAVINQFVIDHTVLQVSLKHRFVVFSNFEKCLTLIDWGNQKIPWRLLIRFNFII
jgi:hypothetical protein